MNEYEHIARYHGYIVLLHKVYKANNMKYFDVAIFNLENNYVPNVKKIKLDEEAVLNLMICNNILAINAYIRQGHIVVTKIDKSIDTIMKILRTVRKSFVNQFGEDIDLAGECIEASVMIITILKFLGYKNAKTVEGWCAWDDECYGSDRPWGEHTWVELNGYYIDITADQFNFGMDPENQLDGIIITKNRPSCMVYDEPSWDDYE